MHSDRQSLRNSLIEAAGNRCPVCGQENVPLELCHIVPLHRGGTTSSENLTAMCAKCNRTMGKSGFSEMEFNYYLKQLMQSSPHYTRVTLEQFLPLEPKYRVDITAENINDESLLIECKNTAFLTRNGIHNAIKQISEYRARSSFSKYILAFPGRISDDGISLLHEAKIEIWDADFIATTFAVEIRNSKHPYFRNLFLSLIPIEELPIEHRFIEQLKSCDPGREYWLVYQKLVGQIFEQLFCPPLESPILESSDKSGTNRRDLIFPNYSDTGFWHFMRQTYMADFIVVEAKNYTNPISKKQILQTSNYIKPHGSGLFALVASRRGANRGAIQTIREHWMAQKKMILVLTDADLEAMLLASSSGGEPYKVIGQALQSFRLSM